MRRGTEGGVTRPVRRFSNLASPIPFRPSPDEDKRFCTYFSAVDVLFSFFFFPLGIGRCFSPRFLRMSPPVPFYLFPMDWKRRVHLSNRSMGSVRHVEGKRHPRRTVRRCIRHHHRHLRDDGERHACAREDGVRATKGKQGNVRNGKNEEERNRKHESESRRWRGGRREEEEPRRPLQRPRECECKRRRKPSPSRWSNDRMTQGY